MKAAPPQLISKFSTLAPGYDVLLCDIWGVVHNGLAVHPQLLGAEHSAGQEQRVEILRLRFV